MILLLEVLAVLAVVFGVAVLLTGHGEGMSDESPDRADVGIPRDRPMTPQDVLGLRFALAFRGYRMAEVDDALDRLAAELAARDAALERLHAQPEEDAAVPAATSEPLETEPEPPQPTLFAAPEPQPLPEPTAPILAAPDAEPVSEPAPPPETAPEPESVADPLTAPMPQALPNPFRPEVPEIPTYDPWAVTPQSRYTEGPTYVEVEHPDDQADHVETIAEHHTGYAPAPEPADEPTDDA